jgi:hypothetical protein
MLFLGGLMVYGYLKFSYSFYPTVEIVTKLTEERISEIQSELDFCLPENAEIVKYVSVIGFRQANYYVMLEGISDVEAFIERDVKVDSISGPGKTTTYNNKYTTISEVDALLYGGHYNDYRKKMLSIYVYENEDGVVVELSRNWY